MTQIGNVSIISTSKKLDIYKLGNYADSQGWSVFCTPKYPTMHLTLHANNIKNIDKMVDMLSRGVKEVLADSAKYAKGPNAIMNEMKWIPTSIANRGAKECYHELFNIDNLDEKPKTKVAA